MATGSKLIEWSKEEDGGASSFSSSNFTKSTLLLQPFNGMNVSRAEDPKDGFIFSCVGCKKTKSMTNASRSTRCTACQSKRKSASQMVKKLYNPTEERPHPKTNLRYVVLDPCVAKTEIGVLRDENRELRRRMAKMQLDKELEENGRELTGAELKRVRRAVNRANPYVEKELSKEGNEYGLALWQVHLEHINAQAVNGGKRRGKRVKCHPDLLNWAIAFLARTSISVYKEVARVMLLPDIRHVQRETAKLVSNSNSRAYSICLVTLWRVKQRAEDEGWTKHQRRVAIAQDSANINTTVEHDI